MPSVFLRILSGLDSGRECALDTGLRVGRNPEAECALMDPGVSWNHARIENKKGKLWIADTGSTNGTLVEGRLIGQVWVRLRPGAEVCFAKVRAQVAEGAASSGPTRHSRKPPPHSSHFNPRRRVNETDPLLPLKAEDLFVREDFQERLKSFSARLNRSVPKVQSAWEAADVFGAEPAPASAALLPSGALTGVLEEPHLETGQFEPPSSVLEKADKPRVLVIDGDRLFRHWSRQILAGAGFEVATADCGIDGLVQVSRGGFQLVICDLRLADIGGSEVLDYARKKGLGMPFLLSSSGTRSQTLVAGKPRKVLRKPATREVLLARVRELLEGKAPALASQTSEHAAYGEGFLEILGDFALEEEIGKGAMGRVFRARQLSLQRTVAVKILDSALYNDADFTMRFLGEARNAASLAHPNIVQVYTVGIDENSERPYYAMEFVDGRTLDELLRTEVLSFRQIVAISRHVSDALALAADRGIVHRDIKPANIIIDTEGRAKVLDFGLSKCFDVKEDGAGTGSQMVLGTPEYISPEQAWGQPVDGRSDLYSLGVVLYRMLAGALPFAPKVAAHALEMHRSAPVRSIRAVRSNVDAGFESLLGQLLAKRPELRPSHPRRIVAALDRLTERLASAGRLDDHPQGPAVEPVRFDESGRYSQVKRRLKLAEQGQVVLPSVQRTLVLVLVTSGSALLLLSLLWVFW